MGISIIDAPAMTLDAILRKHDYIPPPPLPQQAPRHRQTRVELAADRRFEMLREERITASLAEIAAAPPAPEAAPEFTPDPPAPARRTSYAMLAPNCRLPNTDHAAGTAWEAANY